MGLAPEAVLKAVLHTMHMATVYCRNWTLNDDVSTKQINELMEAIHEIPAMATRWNDGTLEEIRMHLACFDSKKWEKTINLVNIFNDTLKRNS